jgi:hypothetical protein
MLAVAEGLERFAAFPVFRQELFEMEMASQSAVLRDRFAQPAEEQAVVALRY